MVPVAMQKNYENPERWPCWSELLVTGPWRAWVNDSPSRQANIFIAGRLAGIKRLQTVTDRFAHVNEFGTRQSN
jgi:hypothetical protein